MPSLAAYPENTLEGLIAREWISMITEIEDFQINLEPICEVISKGRAMMPDGRRCTSTIFLCSYAMI
jgi:hypothetical protein